MAGVEYYTQIGTGNYNEKTSRLYTDLSYMTSRVEIGLEAADVFQALDKGETVKETRHLLVAPNCLQNQGTYNDRRRDPPCKEQAKKPISDSR